MVCFQDLVLAPLDAVVEIGEGTEPARLARTKSSLSKLPLNRRTELRKDQGQVRFRGELLQLDETERG